MRWPQIFKLLESFPGLLRTKVSTFFCLLLSLLLLLRGARYDAKREQNRQRAGKPQIRRAEPHAKPSRAALTSTWAKSRPDHCAPDPAARGASCQLRTKSSQAKAGLDCGCGFCRFRSASQLLLAHIVAVRRTQRESRIVDQVNRRAEPHAELGAALSAKWVKLRPDPCSSDPVAAQITFWWEGT